MGHITRFRAAIWVLTLLLKVFDPTLPRYRLKKRLENYIEFLDDEGSDWQEQTSTAKLPVVLFVYPRASDLIYAKHRTRALLADIWEREDKDRPSVRFTTTDKLKTDGLLTRDNWEET